MRCAARARPVPGEAALAVGVVKLHPPPAFPGMTIGLLGGSFNPPHAGHMHISEVALKRLGLDRLWWLVTPGNPLKTKGDTASFTRRLVQAQKLARHPRIDVTGFEASLGSAYTADMIGFLTRRYPGTRFIWVMGADNLVTFHHWRDWREILGLVPVAVIDRPGYRYAARAGIAAQCFAGAYVDESDANGLYRYQPPAWTFLSAPLSGLSSSGLRANAINES
jgi:nicotinate-nucleotide adenylyltransferase